jgi:hypothetical protein
MLAYLFGQTLPFYTTCSQSPTDERIKSTAVAKSNFGSSLAGKLPKFFVKGKPKQLLASL